MKLFVTALLLWCSLNFALAEHLDLTQLLRHVQKTQGVEGKINKDREAKFLADKDKQTELLSSVQAEFEQQNVVLKKIKTEVADNETELAELEAILKQDTGDLGQLFSVVRQVAGDLKVNLDNSLISAQFPQRSQVLDQIAKTKALPTIDQIETLWITLQQEMTESGKIVHFQTEVLNVAGQPESSKVIRIGNFNALSKGNYLSYLPETGKLVTLTRQPEAEYQDMALDMAAATEGILDVGIDPTRGVILSLLIQTPDVEERIKQGGVVGYIILFMGVIGLVFAIYKLFLLERVGKKMHAQLEQKASSDNPLGRVMLAATESGERQSDNLELLLDEAITREVPALETGLSMIKLLAAVAPLLGLLGTVTGMIATFQAISLFGTGDPKLMANGISQALVTTMLGLCIAIPLLFLHSILASRSRMLIQILDEQSAGLLSRYLEK